MEVKTNIIKLLVPTGLGSTCWWSAVNFFYLMGVLVSAKQLRILSIAPKGELKVFDFVLWLHSYYFVLLDCFPLFLYFSD